MGIQEKRNHLEIFNCADITRAGIKRLIDVMRSAIADDVRRKLGTEYLYNLIAAVESCDRIVELTGDWDKKTSNEGV